MTKKKARSSASKPEAAAPAALLHPNQLIAVWAGKANQTQLVTALYLGLGRDKRRLRVSLRVGWWPNFHWAAPILIEPDRLGHVYAPPLFS